MRAIAAARLAEATRTLYGSSVPKSLGAHVPRRRSTDVPGVGVERTAAHGRAVGAGRPSRCSPKRQTVAACSRLLVCAFAIVLLGPLRALVAQDDSSSREGVIRAPTPPAGAVEHYERGRREYLAGRYRDALQELKAALALDPNSANLVYNVARVNEDLGELEEAINYYRRYRTLLPRDAEEERDKTTKTIRRLQGAKDEKTQLELEQRRFEAQNKPPGPDPAQSHGRADAAFWLIAGTGLALAAGGGVTGFLALRREKEVSDFVLGKDGLLEDRQRLRKQADDFALASDVMSVAAGVAILSAAVLFFSRKGEPDEESSDAGLTVAPQFGGVGLHGNF